MANNAKPKVGVTFLQRVAMRSTYVLVNSVVNPEFPFFIQNATPLSVSLRPLRRRCKHKRHGHH